MSFRISVPDGIGEKARKRIEWIAKQEQSRLGNVPSFHGVLTEKEMEKRKKELDDIMNGGKK
jgi:hypothetical protein